MLSVLLLIAVTGFTPIGESSDDWWHLKAGKLLWEGEMGWYTPDLFTESAKDKVWVNHEWLAEILFHMVTLPVGIRGAILLKTLILAATYLLVFLTCSNLLRRGGTPGSGVHLAALLAVALAIPSSQFTFYLRPPIFTFLFLAVYHAFFLRRSGDPPTLREGLLLTAIMAVWANLHGGAILGCVVVFLMWIGSCLDAFFSPEKFNPRNVQNLKGWVLFGLGLGAASLMNPYGVHLHLLTFEMMSQKWLTERITEMLPPRVDYVWTLPLLLIPAAWGVWREGKWGSRLVFLFLLWQGLSHVRHLPLLSIWAAPYAAAAFKDRVHRPKTLILALLFLVPLLVLANTALEIVPNAILANEFFRLLVVVLLAVSATAVALAPSKRSSRPEAPTHKEKTEQPTGRTRSLFFLIGCALAIGYVTVYAGLRPQQFWRAMKGVEWDAGPYPNRLIDLIVDFDIPGQILLNRENQSGYLIWRLAPERLRIFTCNRFDLQGSLPRMELETLLWCVEDPWRDEQTGIEVRPWREIWEEKYSFDLVILEKYSDRAEPFPFPLWTFLDRPESGYVRVASEVYPGQAFPDQVFSLFVRRGPHLEPLMERLGNRPLLRDDPEK